MIKVGINFLFWMVILTGCFITTDENLWKQSQSDGAIKDSQTDFTKNYDFPIVIPDQKIQTDLKIADASAKEGGLDFSLPIDQKALDGPFPDYLYRDGNATNLPPGASCTASGQCQSGHCVDKVCCKTSCTGLCQMCNNPTNSGTCTPVPSGADPREVCTQDPVSSCGKDGNCDGAGACRFYSDTTICGASTCLNDTQVIKKSCDGSGTCISQVTQTCSPYKCNITAGECYTVCTTSDQCMSGFSCKGLNCK